MMTKMDELVSDKQDHEELKHDSIPIKCKLNSKLRGAVRRLSTEVYNNL